MAIMQRKELGRWGEDTAEKYLEDNGIHIIQKNYRTRYGEVDLIGKEDKNFVFIEVKTRQSQRFGFPEEAVTNNKLDRIETVVWDYFEEFNINDVDWRIDIVSIIRDAKTDQFQLKWIKNVVA